MACYSTLRGYKFPAAEIVDIRGASVYGPKSEKGERKPGEEKLGEIQDVIFEPGTGEIRYVVVDTGGTVLSKWFIIPGEAISSSNKHKDAYQVNLTRSEIEAFPRYDEEMLTSRETWEQYEKQYRSVLPQLRPEPPSERDERWLGFQERLRQHCRTNPDLQRKVS